MDPNKEGNWPVYLQSLLQSLTAAAQSRPRTAQIGQPQAGHPGPTISVQQAFSVCMCSIKSWRVFKDNVNVLH